MEVQEKYESEVTLVNMTLGTLFDLDIVIPDYQRIYCWGDSQVELLLDDLKKNIDEEYRLGTIILYKNEDKYEILDGQQRLVTLLLLFLNIDESYAKITLASQKYRSKTAMGNIAHNKRIIATNSNIERLKHQKEKLLNNITFSVLIVNSKTIDLAYTFFSNTNSKGKSLTDFNLLKAYHLRYFDNQSNEDEKIEYCASEWDNLLSKDDGKYSKEVFNILYLLRNWNRNVWREGEAIWFERVERFEAEHRIQNEFKAIDCSGIRADEDVFYYSEPIIGGERFFNYSSFLAMLKFSHFRNLKIYKQITEGKDRLPDKTNSEKRILMIVKTLLFSYYLKFGEQNWKEAISLIMKYVVDVRCSSPVIVASIYSSKRFANLINTLDNAVYPDMFLYYIKDTKVWNQEELENQWIKKNLVKKVNAILNNLS